MERKNYRIKFIQTRGIVLSGKMKLISMDVRAENKAEVAHNMEWLFTSQDGAVACLRAEINYTIEEIETKEN